MLCLCLLYIASIIFNQFESSSNIHFRFFSESHEVAAMGAHGAWTRGYMCSRTPWFVGPLLRAPRLLYGDDMVPNKASLQCCAFAYRSLLVLFFNQLESSSNKKIRFFFKKLVGPLVAARLL